MNASSMDIHTLRQEVGAELDRWLGDRRKALEHSDLLIDEMTRLIRAGGKRLRPAFCYWGFRAAGRAHADEVLRAAASLELLHTFAIVHDDIMDGSDERRGQPTVHVLHGTSVALLVGDLALVLADDMFMGSGFAPEVVSAGFKAYSRMRQEVIVGQHLDIQTARDPVVTEERARLVARLKSGKYSIEEPLAIGATLAGAPTGFLDALAAFSAPLGEAFQLRDDLLGTFGDRSDVGKPVDSDIREGKRHILYARTVAELTGSQRAFFIEHWGEGDKLTAAEVESLRALVDGSGARAYTEELCVRLTAQARSGLKSLDIDAAARRALEELTELATARSV